MHLMTQLPFNKTLKKAAKNKPKKKEEKAMSMVLVASTVIMKSNIRAFVKLSLFHLVKFWDKDIYGEKSYKTNTVCGWFAKVHNIKKSKDFSWWDRGVSKEMG